MRTTFFIFLACLSSLAIYAQEASNDLKLSIEQSNKIQQINKEAYPKFEEIGRNISLSGYEVNRQRKLLLLEQKKSIMSILTPEQRKIWDAKFNNIPPEVNIRESLKQEYDGRIKEWDRQYASGKKAIENDKSLDKKARKEQLKELSNTYKAEKERLKRERDAVRDSFFY
ncbi:hypothetical protein [Dysgonomonas sp. 25]|uniref:hypothetical protein n=1 Tax=Dysgonomonas sp. 25 TaxID=2302933 RepID=UPI0013D1E97D|nr:hypothetical protein [Dysgonomonas sp. 25]NDV69371.1 hypothetical protein [Dysgonomonas sp. 25]